MRVLLIRHAIAEDQAEFAKTGQPDDERPLTKAGIEEMEKAARGLSRILSRLDLLATSPLVRAVQTADVVAAHVPHDARATIDVLKPGAPFPELVSWLERNRSAEVVAAVGHNPHLSGLACYLMGAPSSAIDMKKGAALLLEFNGQIRAETAELLWYLKPSQLRQLEG